jgi:hypothetical protein
VVADHALHLGCSAVQSDDGVGELPVHLLARLRGGRLVSRSDDGVVREEVFALGACDELTLDGLLERIEDLFVGDARVLLHEPHVDHASGVRKLLQERQAVGR